MSSKDHFWIPDSEVVRLEQTPGGRSKSMSISFEEHGSKLSNNLSEVIETMRKYSNNDSLRELDTVILEVKLPDGEKVKDRSELFKSNGMSVKAVKTENEAIVATTKSQFEELQSRVKTYSMSGKNKTHFDYIDEFKPFIGPEKKSLQLQKKIKSKQVSEKVDINLMLVPNLSEDEYSSIIKILLEKIKSNDGKIFNSGFELSDNTPLIRAIIPSSSIINYEVDSAVYRIEETDFF